MKTTDVCKTALIPMALALVWLSPPARAQVQLVSEGHGAGTQCASTGVNDGGEVVGACRSGTGVPVAFTAPAGIELPLAPPSGSLGCAAEGVANDGTVVGQCRTNAGTLAAVRWSSPAASSAPEALTPLSLLGLLNQVSSIASSFNQVGVIGGSSLDGNGNGTAVLWMRGQTSPTQVSNGGDNCTVVDETDALMPVVILNCPDGNGRKVAKYAVPTGLLGTYSLRPMATDPDALNCYAAGINNKGMVIGTCEYATTPYDRLATWKSPYENVFTSAISNPVDLTEYSTRGAFINNNGNIVVHFRGSKGYDTAAYIDGATLGQLIIPASLPGTPVVATALADNNRVLVEREDTVGRVRSGIFEPATPNTMKTETYPGALNSGVDAISMSGNNVAGSVEDADHTETAVAARVP